MVNVSMRRVARAVAMLPPSWCRSGVVLSAVAMAWVYPARGTAQARSVPLSDYIAGFRTVEVGLGRSGETHTFLFDTGGGITVLTPATAAELGCTPFGRMTGFRSSGERLDGPRCGIVVMELGGQTFRDETAVFDLMALLGNAPPVSGLISLYTFRELPITLDLSRNLLVLETPESLRERVRDMEPADIRVGRQAGGTALDVFLAIQGEPLPAWFLVDSGNTGNVIVAPHARRQIGLPEGELEAGRFHIDGVGGFEAALTFSDRIYDGVLNIGTLQRMVLTLDLARQRAWLLLDPT